MNHQRAVIAALAGILFFYFFLRPTVDLIAFITIIMIWIMSMIWDLRVTFSNESYIPNYEQSFVLVFFYGRFSIIPTILFVMFVETTCVILLPVVFLYETNQGCSMIVAYFFTVLHVMATHQNEKFIENLEFRIV